LPQTASTIEGTLRFLRIVHAALFVAIVLYVYVAEGLLHPAVQPLDSTFYVSMMLAGFASTAIAIVVRHRMLPPAFEALQTNPNSPASLNRWRVGILIGDSLAVSVALYGFVLRMIGASTARAVPFYACSFVLMLL
jgi:hypothetical protein